MLNILKTGLVILVFAGSSFADEKQILENYIRSRVENTEYKGDMKCGTRYVFMLHQYWDQLDPAVQSLYKIHLLAPPVREQQLSTEHFTLHWDETTYHAVPLLDIEQNGIPDYIDSAVVIFEHVWDIEVNSMGYQPPLNESGNPVETYHIYFSNITDYGATWFTGSDDDIPSIPGVQKTSYIEMDNDYIGFDTPGLAGLKVTAAHEFHHAVQFCYNLWFDDSNYYFLEMTSTWMEEVVYPDVNDFYFYLPDLFNLVSNTPFNTDPYVYPYVYPYGNSLYLHMIEKKYGADIIRLIWDEIKNQRSLDAIKDVLGKSPYYSTWSESLNEYGVWLYYTGDRAQENTYFNNAHEFPQVRILSSDTLKFDTKLQLNTNINKLANRYIKMKNSDKQNYTLSVTSGATSLGGFRELSNNHPFSFNNLNKSIEINKSASTVILITNASTISNTYNININESRPALSYPNPIFSNNSQNYIRFLNIPEEGNIYIYDLLGKRVAELEINSYLSDIGWDLKNYNGNYVTSGMYFFLAKGKGLEKTGKIVILR